VDAANMNGQAIPANMNGQAIPGAYLFHLYVCDKEMS